MKYPENSPTVRRNNIVPFSKRLLSEGFVGCKETLFAAESKNSERVPGGRGRSHQVYALASPFAYKFNQNDEGTVNTLD